MLESRLIKAAALRLGADAVGIARPSPVSVGDKYRRWLDNGYAGDMTYLTRQLDKRLNPGLLFPGAKSIIVVGSNYFPAKTDEERVAGPFRVAKYAWGEDYHKIIRKILTSLRADLKVIYPLLNGRICVDAAPFIDKYWAQEAGLGWIGKHSILVSRQFGSWLLLGSLIINIEVDIYDKPHANHCGRCSACLNSCPTGAFPEEYIVDATKCLSHWTIESKVKFIPEPIRKNMNRWIFGCDICLNSCPFNRFEQSAKTRDFDRRGNVALLETGQVVDLSENEFQAEFKSSSVSRAGLSGLKRNIRAANRSPK
jgi:epoxyqueuosine reductase